MVYLLAAVVSSAMVSVCMRLGEGRVRGVMVMFTANYAVCFSVSRFYLGNVRLFAAGDGMGTAAGLGLVSGFLYLGSFALYRFCIGKNGVVLSGASMKLGGVLVPVVTAVLFFRERLTGPRLWGVVLAVAAILLINLEKEEVRVGGGKIWLPVLLLASGLTDTMASLYQKTGTEALKNHYLCYTFLSACLLAFLMAVRGKERLRAGDILWGVLVGVPNYYSSRFLLLALGEVPAVIVYPVYSVGAIIVITLAGLAVFRERLSRQKAGALALISAALVLLDLP